MTDAVLPSLPPLGRLFGDALAHWLGHQVRFWKFTIPVGAPVPLAATLVLFVLVVAATRHISMGSVVAAGSLPLAVWMIEHPPGVVLIASMVAAVFIIYRHRANVERIRVGNEHVFRFGGK